MTHPDIRAVFLEELTRIAPDIEPDSVGEDDHIQDDLELDSMDILNLVTALHERLGVDIPEAQYDSISTLSRATDFLTAKMAEFQVTTARSPAFV